MMLDAKRHRTGCWLGMLATAALLLPFASAASAHKIEKHFTVDGRPVINVNSIVHGHITVKSWKHPEVVVAGNHSSDKVEVDTEQAGNRIEVTTHILDKSVKPEDVDADYELTVPEESELQVRTDSGLIVVERVFGDMTFDTVSGDIHLKQTAGYVDIHTIAGSLICTECAGRLEVRTISGNIQILQPQLNTLRVSTTSGNILFDGDFLRRGTYSMSNASGFTEVRFSENDSFDLQVKTSKGTLDNQAQGDLKPDKHGLRHLPSRFAKGLMGSVNQGLARVDLSTFNGTIRIRKHE
jgi:DUF4097 and DUF4098 domain-containing protein YvlB